MWSPELTNRLRVLLHALPLLDLRSWDGQRSQETHHYDSIALAMRVLDYIIDSSGLGVDADSEAIFHLLSPLITQMDIAADVVPNPALQRQFVDSLLGKLRNDRNSLRQFELPYKAFSDGKLIERKLEFRILEERAISDDGVFLQLSSEAINLFLNALDVDVEDAQIALESIIQAQLKRGRFDKAITSARDARFRSIQFEQKIERILRDTRRDIARVDWREQTPRLLREAIEHINGRLGVEKDIADNARQRLDQLELGSQEAQQVAVIAELMDECAERHSRLHGVLLGARQVFFAEQNRQTFVVRPMTQLPNLQTDVLEPLLAGSKRFALEVLYREGAAHDGVLPALLGAQAPGVFSLHDYMTALLRPRREIKRISKTEEAQIWSERTPDILRFTPQVQSAAHFFFPVPPTPLSVILDQAAAARQSGAVLEYITLSALEVFSEGSKDGLEVNKLGRSFARHGFWGDDLELLSSQESKDVDSIVDASREVR